MSRVGWARRRWGFGLACVLSCGAVLAESGNRSNADASTPLTICHNQEISPEDGEQPAFAALSYLRRALPSWHFELRALPWARCLLMVELGEIDAALGASVSGDRLAQMAYPRLANGDIDSERRMYHLGYVLLQRPSAQLRWDGHQFSAAGESRIGVQRGNSIAEAARRRGAQIDESSADAGALLARLALGRLDDVRVSQPHWRRLQEDPTYRDQLQRVGPLVESKDYFLLLSKAFVAARPRQADQVWAQMQPLRQDAAFLTAYRQHVGDKQAQP